MELDNKKYTPQQIEDAKKILDAFDSVPADKQPILAAMMDAFITGMDAQERLNRNQPA